MLRHAISTPLLLLLSWPGTGTAAVETCTLPVGSYEWTGPCSPSVGEIVGCNCNAHDPDLWVVPAGAAVTCAPGPDAEATRLTFGSSEAQIRIDAGGSLALGPGCTLDVPGGGLEVSGGLRVSGAVLTYGGELPGFTTDALADSADPSVNTSVRLEGVIPCPGSDAGVDLREDCEATAATSPGSRQQIALCFSGDTPHSAWMARIRPGDVLVFWDPSNGIDPPRDVNAFYRIDGSRQQADSSCLILNVLQGGESSGYGIKKREISELTLWWPYRAGQRTLLVGTQGITSDKQGVARWLTCPAPSAGGSRTLYTQKVTNVDDNPDGDIITLLPGGFPVSLPLGTHCYMDYGWMPGDVVSVWRPAELADGTPDSAGDSEVHCNPGANCDFDFALLGNRGRVLLQRSSDIDNAWLIDAAAAADIVALHLINWTETNVSERVQITAHATPSAHSVAIDGEGFDGGTLVDWNIRHSEDDYFVPNTVQEEISDQTLKLRRLRVGYMGCTGGSCSIIDSNSAAGSGLRRFSVDLDGLLAEDPGGEESVGSSFYVGRSGTWTLRNMVFVAAEEALFEGYVGSDASEERTILRNVYDVGRNVDILGTEILGGIHDLEDVSLIDPRMTHPGGMLRLNWGRGADWSRILVLDPSNAYPLLLSVRGVGGPVMIRDLAIVGFDRTAGTGGVAVEVQRPAGERFPVRLQNLTLALRPGARAAQQSAIRFQNDGPAERLRGLLIAHFAGEPAESQALILGGDDADRVSDVCMRGNEVDSNTLAGIGGVVLREPGMDFVDPDLGLYRLKPGSPGYGICGAGAPGATDMWALRVLHHDPYQFGDSWKTGTCGNGVIDAGEDCDDENASDGDGCSAACERDSDGDGAVDAVDNCPLAPNSPQEDRDLDALGDLCDSCPDYNSSQTRDTDGNGIGDVCECGDANGDGRVDVLDLIAISRAIFDPELATPLCDSNYDGLCRISDVIGAYRKLFGEPAYCSRYPPR